MEQQTLTSDLLAGTDPRHWRLSVQVCRGSLDAVLRPMTGPGDFMYACVKYPAAGAADTAAALEEAVYANPLLVVPFGRVDVLVREPRYVLVPAPEPDSALPARAAAVMGFPADADTEVISVSAGRLYSLVYAADARLLNFIRRTFDVTAPSHPLAVLTCWFQSRAAQGNSAKVYVNLREEFTDIFVFNSLGPAAVTTIAADAVSDCCYYILAMAHSAGLVPDDYEVHLAGLPQRRGQLAAELRRFVPTVVPATFPAALLAQGQKALTAPLELSVIPLCE